MGWRFVVSDLQAMPEETIGKRIKRLYEAKGMKRYGFAKRLGVAYTTVNNWERDESPSTPELETLKRVADLLGCAVSDLTGSSVASAPVALAPTTEPAPEAVPALLLEFLSSGRGGNVTADERAALRTFLTGSHAWEGGAKLEHLDRALRLYRGKPAVLQPASDPVAEANREAKSYRQFPAKPPVAGKKR